MTALEATPRLALHTRLWRYQAERFPLIRTGVLCTVFAAAGISVSAHLAGRPLPGLATFAVAALVTVALFFLLRVSDEVKDADADRRYRPERPVPRGLVTLRLLVGLAIAAATVALAATAALDPGLVVFLTIVLAFMALMAREFFAPNWLQARPVAYLVSHMSVMPLIDLYVTATEWWPAAGWPPRGIALFLALSFVNGCVLEIGRKTWAPAGERAGVESYSRLWGPAAATRVWLAIVATAAVLAAAIGARLGAPIAIGAALAAGGCGCGAVAARFLHRPDAIGARALDAASGLWVLVCYAALGFLPMALAG